MNKKKQTAKSRNIKQKKQLIYKKIKLKTQSTTYTTASFGYNTCSVP